MSEEISPRIKRINELAHKAKTIGLTEEETKERDILRKEYIADFRKRMRAEIEKIEFVDEKGGVTPIKRTK